MYVGLATYGTSSRQVQSIINIKLNTLFMNVPLWNKIQGLQSAILYMFFGLFPVLIHCTTTNSGENQWCNCTEFSKSQWKIWRKTYEVSHIRIGAISLYSQLTSDDGSSKFLSGSKSSRRYLPQSNSGSLSARTKHNIKLYCCCKSWWANIKKGTHILISDKFPLFHPRLIIISSCYSLGQS